ncbi:hypothetical protein FSP39_013188 [Pinctada imbricata]|uniref:Deubiquitinating protein VCPIP1 n=1 Tax=Pinctada imbricata TaxID=66713 RepID=A0AA89C7H6_PINIB|nr:hypothetical protein FSP39_013188 [Pinctada imbricata]
MQRANRKSADSYKVLCGYCPDEKCKTRLFFPAYDRSIECPGCGQRHEQSTILNVAEVTNPGVALHNILKNKLLESVKPKKGADNVKVLGLSNYVCKLISPILTHYGMDKKSGKAKLLSELSQPEILDCGKILGDRAFLIEEENLDVIGYGRDRTGSRHYLADTLNVVKEVNDNEERLVPIHADGDGHCLVHAVSRALVGRELFWHSLRLNLMYHLKDNLFKYKELFKDYIDVDEWEDIISECDPEFIPRNGEPLGLRNIHVFGLANVLRRPIILLDSVSGLQSPGDYSGVFLPGFVEPDQCRSRDGSLNKPLCIAWSSSGRNHYIPLVGVKGRPIPMLPNYMIQKSWGMPAVMINKYIDFDSNGRCKIGGDKCLSDRYIQQLVNAMGEIFYEKYKVQSQLVADVHQYMYKSSGMVGVLPSEVIQTTIQAVERGMLYRCLTCEAIMEYHLPPEWFKKGGELYKLAYSTHGVLKSDKKYSFPYQGVICSYSKETDELIPDMSRSKLSTCTFCSGTNVRVVNGDGSIHYENGDRTTTPSASGRCTCGYKHYWDGKEYDNLPEVFPISLEWNGQVVAEKVVWFQYESDPTLNSNVFEVAQSLVQKHFPGEFGSERLVQRVVDTILRQTAASTKEKGESEGASALSPYDDAWSASQPSKIILTGHKHKTMHKEELTKSEKERQVRRNIQREAPKQQQRKTKEIAALENQSPKSSPKKTKPTPSEPRASSASPIAMETSSAKPENVKRVRLATSDGRQVMLTLTKDITFRELQTLIEEKVSVPHDRQKIRLGFPPKELKAPPPGEEDAPISVAHGDKIMLEIVSVRSHSVDHMESEIKSSVPTHDAQRARLTQSWSGFDEDIHQSAFDSLMQNIKDTGQGSDSIDAAIASMAIVATLKGRDLWTHVQTMPHLFSVGGLFYKQVERDLGLVDGKHCQLPSLPGRVFRYSQAEDRLELCLEPYGHFPVEPNVENRAKEPSLHSMDTEDSFSSFSGALGRQKPKHTAFSGQGHSLAASVGTDDRMPQDISPSHHPTARGAHTLCDPTQHQESITEEQEEDYQMEEQSEGGATSHTLRDTTRGYQRLGPGFSILDYNAVNRSNENARLFKDLADNIEKTINEEIAEIDKEMEIIDEEERKKSESLSSANDVSDSITNQDGEEKKTEDFTMKDDSRELVQGTEVRQDSEILDETSQSDVFEGATCKTEITDSANTCNRLVQETEMSETVDSETRNKSEEQGSDDVTKSQSEENVTEDVTNLKENVT